MDKIEKVLRKLSVKERAALKQILLKLNAGQLQGLDLKKLKGRDDIFRVRKGDFRVIYRQQGQEIFILLLDRRREDTYKF